MVMGRTTCRNFNSGLAFHAPENLKIQLKCSYVLMIVLTRETAWLVSTAENFNLF